MHKLSQDHASGWLKRNFVKWQSWLDAAGICENNLLRNPESAKARAAIKARRLRVPEEPAEFTLPMWSCGFASFVLLLSKWSTTLDDDSKDHARSMLDVLLSHLPAGDIKFYVSRNPEHDNVFPTTPEQDPGCKTVEVTDRKIHVQKMFRGWPGLQQELTRLRNVPRTILRIYDSSCLKFHGSKLVKAYSSNMGFKPVLGVLGLSCHAYESPELMTWN